MAFKMLSKRQLKLIKLIKTDKNSKIKTGRLSVVAVYATVEMLLLSLFSTV
jgi:hypothetical protein